MFTLNEALKIAGLPMQEATGEMVITISGGSDDITFAIGSRDAGRLPGKLLDMIKDLAIDSPDFDNDEGEQVVDDISIDLKRMFQSGNFTIKIRTS